MARPTLYQPKGAGAKRAGLSMERIGSGFRITIQERPPLGSRLRDAAGNWWVITSVSGNPGNWLCGCRGDSA